MGAAQEPLTPTRNVNFDKVYCADRRASRNSRLSRDSRHSRTGGAGGAGFGVFVQSAWHLLSTQDALAQALAFSHCPVS